MTLTSQCSKGEQTGMAAIPPLQYPSEHIVGMKFNDTARVAPSFSFWDLFLAPIFLSPTVIS